MPGCISYQMSISPSILQDQTIRRSRNKKKRVLLVEDEPDTCMVYQMVLEDAGYDCISYTKEFRPNYSDLILLAIKMPVLNGFELCKKLIDKFIDDGVHCEVNIDPIFTSYLIPKKKQRQYSTVAIDLALDVLLVRF
jgi:CheY-like chemotaxis protein